MTAIPRFATPATPDRPNLGRPAVRIAKLLGLELMEWQVAATELLTEMEEGRFSHPDATVLLPRQNGKSTWIAVNLLVQALGTPGSRCFYCAQSLKDSRTMLLETWLPMLETSPLAGSFTARQANGSEQLRFSNGSTISLIAPTSKKAGHGVVCDYAVVDEAFALPDSRMETALRPAMSTRSNFGAGPRFWVVSTAGTPAGSPYLAQRVEQGRKLVAEGVTSGSAYIEYSAADDADPLDPETWRSCNPALDRTISEAAIWAELESMDRNDFLRSRMNVWTTTKAEPVVPLEVWSDLVDRGSGVNPERVFFAFDSTPDGSWSSIAVASKRSDERIHVELVAHNPGTGWLASELKRLKTKHGPRAIVCDPRSPAANALPHLKELGVQVEEMASNEQTRAFSGFVAACNEDQLRHIDQPELTAALLGAVRRPVGDAYMWSRRSSANDISPIVACSMAVHAVLTMADSEPNVWSVARVLDNMAARDAEELRELNKAAGRHPSFVPLERAPYRGFERPQIPHTPGSMPLEAPIIHYRPEGP